MHDEYFFIFFQKTFGLHFAIFEIFWPSLILNLYFALRFALLYFDLHFVKLILFCSERSCENMRFALLQSVLAVRQTIYCYFSVSKLFRCLHFCRNVCLNMKKLNLNICSMFH